ncbi:MAG TPA: hypothetical protein VKU40_03590 [Thermoanaerobaculia bacterium]|nr:hypothetical protein [Thermoanaerobaculia bacterium]
MSKRTTCLLGIAAFVAICLLVTAPAQAGLKVDTGDCGPRIQAPAKLISAVVVDRHGNAIEGALPEIHGIDLEIDGLGLLGDGAAVRVNDEIARGILRNTGDRTVLLTFGNGETVQLQAGEEAVVANEAVCKCKCTCTAGEHSTTALFPCDNNQDTCAYNGDDCVFVAEGEVQEGTYSGCKKVWVIRPAQPAEPGTATP